MIMMFVLHIGHRENFQMKLRRKYFLGFDVIIYCDVPCRQSAILLYYNFILCAFSLFYVVFIWLMISIV